MPLTPEKAFELGQLGANQCFKNLKNDHDYDNAVPPFVRQAEQLGLPPRSVPPQEEHRLVFELLCLALAVIGVQSRKHVLTDSIFNPKLDLDKHQRFLEGMFEGASQNLELEQISSLRERLPHGKRNADSLEYRDGKPLAISHLRTRVEAYMRAIIGKAERGQDDAVLATRQDFVFHLTELLTPD